MNMYYIFCTYGTISYAYECKRWLELMNEVDKILYGLFLCWTIEKLCKKEFSVIQYNKYLHVKYILESSLPCTDNTDM